MSDDQLNARLRRLEDLAEISQLFVDYGAYLDAGDFDSYGSLFAPDAELLLGPMGRATGRDDIRALMTAALGGHTGESYHVISSPVVRIDGDHATARVMWTVIHRGADGRPALGMVGHHRDELVRHEGRWLFARRAGFVDLPASLPNPAQA